MYAQALNTATAQPAPPSRPFERIETAADRAESVVASIGSFLDRVNGSAAIGGTRDTASAAPGYVNQLDRLHFALEQIETQLQQLHAAG